MNEAAIKEKHMGKVLTVAAGKGGVGKTTISCNLARNLAAHGHSTVIVELDSGMRSVDLIFNIDHMLYDLNDFLDNRCCLDDAIVRTNQKNLFLLAASSKFSGFPTEENLKILCKILLSKFEYVILDAPAGCYLAKTLSNITDLFLLVTTTDPICVRDVAAFTCMLLGDYESHAQMRLIINRIDRFYRRKGYIESLDEIIDMIGVQLIGLIPEKKEIRKSMEYGTSLPAESEIKKIFEAIAKRIEGEAVPLIFNPR